MEPALPLFTALFGCSIQFHCSLAFYCSPALPLGHLQGTVCGWLRFLRETLTFFLYGC